MAKFMIQAVVSGEGMKGIEKDTATVRQSVVAKAVKGLGGKLEVFYFSLGEYDVVAVVDLPDTTTAAALALHISDTGLVRTRTTALLSVEETNQAIKKKVEYRAPGK